MLVKEIAALAAAVMGREDLEKAARTLAGEPHGELSSLLRCYNLFEIELALDYFPLNLTLTFLPHDGILYYALFSCLPADILRAESDGKEVAFRIFPNICCSFPLRKKK